jgi:hypothetical protein
MQSTECIDKKCTEYTNLKYLNGKTDETQLTAGADLDKENVVLCKIQMV